MKKILVLALAITLLLGASAYAAENPSFTPISWGYTVSVATFEGLSGNDAIFEIYRHAENGGSFCHTFDAKSVNVNLNELEPGEEYCIFYTTKNGAPEELVFFTDYVWGDIYAPPEKKAEFLALVDVLKGYPDGSYHLANSITRAEFSALLMRAIQANDTTTTSQPLPFTDTKGHWAEDSIGAAYNLGIIKGVSATEFAPESPVTHDQMATMVVRAIGLADYAEAKGGYPDGYWDTAYYVLYIVDSYPDDRKAPATREAVVEILFAIMDYTPKEKPAYDFLPAPAKPVIYLYPEQEQQVTVTLDIVGEFTFTYPAYNSGWSVLAQPDGTLTDATGKEYSYLFWEGIFTQFVPDFSEGFVVKGEDSVAFLQEKLAALGLTPREYNEFIVYWAPQMEQNAYNMVYFAGDEYDQNAPLTITPKPDSVLRVFMLCKPTTGETTLPPQTFAPFERKGFTVVEWGGDMLPS